MDMKKISSILVALVLCLAFATTAFGQSAVDGYNDIGGQVQSGVGGSGTPPAATTADTGSGSLPFTGLDVALFAGAGGLLLLAGFGMRRLTRSPDTA
jgi:hypothetical protein